MACGLGEERMHAGARLFLAGQGGLGSVNREAVLGMLSLVFWSITLITTVKYVLIVHGNDIRAGCTGAGVMGPSTVRHGPSQ